MGEHIVLPASLTITTPRFSADSPKGICALFAAGKLSRARTIVELALYPYQPSAVYDMIDQLPLTSGKCSWDEVLEADDQDLLEDGMYGQAQELRHLIFPSTEHPKNEGGSREWRMARLAAEAATAVNAGDSEAARAFHEQWKLLRDVES